MPVTSTALDEELSPEEADACSAALSRSRAIERERGDIAARAEKPSSRCIWD